jgi:hypothetical protein
MTPTPQMPPQGSPDDVMAADADAAQARMQSMAADAPTVEEVKVKDLEGLADEIASTLMALLPDQLDEEQLRMQILPDMGEEKFYSGPLPEGLYAALNLLQMLAERVGLDYDLRLEMLAEGGAQFKRVQGMVAKMGKDKKFQKAMQEIEAAPEAAPEEMPESPMSPNEDEIALASM